MKKIGSILFSVFQFIWIVIVSPLLIIIVIISKVATFFEKKIVTPEKIYDIYVTCAPGDFSLAQEFIQTSKKRGLRCFLSEYRQSEVFPAAINGSKEHEKQLENEILKSFSMSRSFVLISSGKLKDNPSGAFAKAITTVTTNSDRLNLFEMSLWRHNNDRINIIIVKENGSDLLFERHTFDPAYLTIGYDYSDGKIGENIDSVVKDLNNPLPKSVEDTRFLMASHKILELGKFTPVDVYAFSGQFEDEVRKTIINEFGGKAQTKKSGLFTLNTSSFLKMQLECPDAEIEDSIQEFIWKGTLCKATFQVKVPISFSKDQILLKGKIYADNVLICNLSSALDVKKQNPEPFVNFKRVEKAFASYSSKDRDSVLLILEGIQHIAPWMDIFLDVKSLRSGENWEPQLFNKIDWADVLYLFWSRHARESLFVEREWRYALNKKGIEFIEPIPLEKPEIAPPPDELKQKHFGCWALYFMSNNNLL
ncbi:MAG: toll/interleukin-1 receptor domain-containing protein [Dysgonamonadaceae bacterium]|jgi:hypothetical protein|nr:toll/interleukin-1 receptor domain-containing protein [Dysgonamonadaceae bacterium]